MQVDTISDTAGFDALEEQWDPLLAQSRQNGPFLRFKWLRAWWDEYGGGSRLHVLACREGGRLLGVLPLFVTRTGRLVKASAARFLGDSDVGSTGLTAFAQPDRESEAFHAFARRLAWKSPGFDLLDLRFMDQDHRFYEVVTGEAGAEFVASRCDCCPRISLPQEWEEYLGGLTKHMRHEIRRSTRRVAERGFEFETVRHAEDLPQAIEDFHRLNALRLRQKFGESFEVPEAGRRFATRSMADLFAEGALRLSFMRRGQERVTGLYQLRHGDTMYAMESGFCEEGRQDTQRALWGHTIRNAIEEGCARLDLLLGDHSYKHDWGVTDVRALSRVRLYRRTPSGLLRESRDAIADRLEARSSGRRQAAGMAEATQAREAAIS